MESLATIVVVPRETFSQAVVSLESVFRGTKAPFELVYVDCTSPPLVRRELERESLARHFTLLRSAEYLSPTQARNAGFAHVRTKYTVFLGNDVLVADGWLESLVACAEETGASFVGGVSCWGRPDAPLVYCAGGESRIISVGGTRHLRDVHYRANQRFSDVRGELRRQPSEAAVFHCMLVRSDVFRNLGALDEQLPVLDHVDWCLRAQREANGGWFEPASVVTQLTPSFRSLSDAQYFLLRWSRAWIESSFAHFRRKWSIDPHDPGLEGNARWLENHRWRVLGRPGVSLRRRVGDRTLRPLEILIDATVTQTLVRHHARTRPGVVLSVNPVVPTGHEPLGGYSRVVDHGVDA